MVGNALLGAFAVICVGTALAVRSGSGYAQTSPPPAAARTEFVISFALNSRRLDETGRRVASNAAAAALSLGATRVTVVGHADQSGNPEYNLLLSRRRAEAVVAALQRNGVGASIIQVDWKGEFEPTVQADAQVVEPRNRRVAIRISL